MKEERSSGSGRGRRRVMGEEEECVLDCASLWFSPLHM